MLASDFGGDDTRLFVSDFGYHLRHEGGSIYSKLFSFMHLSIKLLILLLAAKRDRGFMYSL